MAEDKEANSSFVDEFDMQGADISAPEDKLAALHEMARQCKEAEDEIEALDNTLSAVKSALQALRTVKMPDLMNQLQMPEFVFDNYKFKLRDFVSGSFPKDFERRKKAIELLTEYDAAGLIKTEITIPFAKSQHNEALSLFAYLEKEGYPATMNENVHTQTYQAFARQRLEEGEEIDMEGLSLMHGKVVKFSEIK